MAGNSNAGRKTKLTEDKIKEVCAFVADGLPVNSACVLSNISETLYYDWKKKGVQEETDIINEVITEEEGTLFIKFLKSARLAEENYVKRNIDLINSAAKKDASYAKWLLQVKKPDDYGAKTSIEITTKFTEMKQALEEFGEGEDIKE